MLTFTRNIWRGASKCKKSPPVFVRCVRILQARAPYESDTLGSILRPVIYITHTRPTPRLIFRLGPPFPPPLFLLPTPVPRPIFCLVDCRSGGHGLGVAFMTYVPELKQVYYADKGSNILKVARFVLNLPPPLNVSGLYMYVRPKNLSKRKVAAPGGLLLRLL